MGQPFFAHMPASISLIHLVVATTVPLLLSLQEHLIHLFQSLFSLLTDAADQRAMIGGTGTSVLSVVVSWVASDGSVPNTNTGKAISVTLTNPAIKNGAKVYSIIGNQSRLY